MENFLKINSQFQKQITYKGHMRFTQESARAFIYAFYTSVQISWPKIFFRDGFWKWAEPSVCLETWCSSSSLRSFCITHSNHHPILHLVPWLAWEQFGLKSDEQHRWYLILHLSFWLDCVLLIQWRRKSKILPTDDTIKTIRAKIDWQH